MKPGFVWSTLVVLLSVVAACSTSAEKPAEPPVDDTAILAPLPERPDLEPLIKGPRSADGLQAILGTGDLGVGTNRVGFVLTSPDGIVTAPSAKVTPRYLPPGGSEWQPRPPTMAKFNPWPYGTRGLYTTELTFDGAGSWTVDIAPDGQHGPSGAARLDFEVRETPYAPAVGSPALKSRNKTIADVQTLDELTTGSLQDPDLYRTTIADAVASGSPTVVVFASPAYCVNAVCGPQLEVLQELKNRYKERANFIHVDFYDNPHEVQGDLESARLSPTVREWRLPSIEWTFVIDRQGIVSARFEAFVTIEELEEALFRVM